jgi:hypothetical protein
MNELDNKSTNNNVLEGDTFFNTLDRQIHGDDDDEEYVPIQPQESNAKLADNNANTNPDTEKRLNNLEKRYEASSTEGQRLAKENERLAKQLEDAKNGSSNSPQPKNIKEFLKLGDDFVYDTQEAIDDPESDSGKYRKAELALEVHRQSQEQKNLDNREALANVQAEQKQALMKKFRLSESDWEKFQDKVANSDITLEDTYLLFNPELVTDNAIRGIIGESNRHRQKISAFGNNTIVESGQGEENQSESGKVVFDKLFNIDNSKFRTVDEI